MPRGSSAVAAGKLSAVDAAMTIDDLRVPPGYRLQFGFEDDKRMLAEWNLLQR
jgi:plasmid maintenance system killer protein